MTLPALTQWSTGAVAQRARQLVELVTTPLLPADYLDMFSPLRAGGDLCGRIVEVRSETCDAVTLVIKAGRAWRSHRPGQYVRIGVDVDGVRHWRAYSLTSLTKDPDRQISVTVKAVSGGMVSQHLVHGVSAGTIVMLDQAAGDFTLPEQAPRKVLFLTAGSGLTPVMGMLRNSLQALDDVVLLHSAPTSGDVLFATELRTLAAQGRLRLVERHTSKEGRFAVAGIADQVPDWAQRQTWACGPAGLLDAAEEHWGAAGVAGRLHVERFRPVVRGAGEGGSVTFSRSGVSVRSDGATPLLTAGEEAGVLMPSGCRMGICFSCVVPLREGAVRDLRNGETTTATPDHPVLIQTCVSASAGTCDIDL